MKKAKIFCAFFLLIFCCYKAGAQSSCGNCDQVPKITQFDFDIRVPQPDTSNGTNNLWPEWKNLFMIASSVGVNLKKAEGNCIRFMIPPSIDTGDAQVATIGGETFSNLPTNPLLDKDLSTYGDYLMTGSITSNGATCNLHVEIQASCSRKLVVSADVSFALSSVIGSVNSIAQQIASKLSPLSQKIKEFELEQRKKDPSLSLFKISNGDIKVTPLKRTLKGGESTTVTIEVKDCDGIPLAGREIVFSKDSFGGLKISGTVGGTITPAKVTTDANGVAKVNFTLRSGAQYAIIAAHSPGLDVKGCSSMLFGDAAINIRYNYSGHVQYTYESNTSCKEVAKSICSITEHRSENAGLITYIASFYSTTQKGRESISLSGEDKEESSGLDIPEVLEGGEYSDKTTYYNDHVITCESAQKGWHTVNTSRSHMTGSLKHGQIRFTIPEKSGEGTLLISLDFITVQNHVTTLTLNPMTSGSDSAAISHSVNFEGGTGTDKDIKFKREIINGKVTFTISGSRSTPNPKCPSGVTETIKCVIIQE